MRFRDESQVANLIKPPLMAIAEEELKGLPLAMVSILTTFGIEPIKILDQMNEAQARHYVLRFIGLNEFLIDLLVEEFQGENESEQAAIDHRRELRNQALQSLVDGNDAPN